MVKRAVLDEMELLAMKSVVRGRHRNHDRLVSLLTDACYSALSPVRDIPETREVTSPAILTCCRRSGERPPCWTRHCAPLSSADSAGNLHHYDVAPAQNARLVTQRQVCSPINRDGVSGGHRVACWTDPAS